MAKIKAVKLHTDFCEDGVIKYPAGTTLSQNDESTRLVALNFGEVITVDEKLVTDPVAEKAAADKAAADKLAAIQAKQAEIAELEAQFAALPETEEPGFAAGFLAKVGIGAKGSARESVQAALDAKRVELAALQPTV